MSEIYLRNVLRKYKVNVLAAKANAVKLHPIIDSWGNRFILSKNFSGSLEKGTAVNIGTDADIFISLSSTTPETLEQIYTTLYNRLIQSGYPTRKQNVSIGITINNYNIDLVPAKRHHNYGNDHSLYKNKTSTWTQTNVTTHINYVKNSNRLEEIKLLKIWRCLHRLSFSSFYLELVVINVLKGSKIGDILNNFIKVLKFLANDFLNYRVIDRANTNNIISNDLTVLEKKTIVKQAEISLSKKNWSEIIW